MNFNMGFMPSIEKRIVTERCSTIRALARQVLKGHWFDAILVLFTVYIITNLPVMIVTAVYSNYFVNLLCNIYSVFIRGPLMAGSAYYFLRLFRQEDNGIKDLMFAREYCAQGAILYMHIMLRVILGMLLFVVPGVLAAFKYSQSFYVLADDPRKMPYQCLAESKYIMQGNKMKLFLLNLSFIGWYIVSSIPQSIAETFAMPANFYTAQYSFDELLTIMEGISADPKVIVASLLHILVEVYVMAAMAAFYDIATCKLSVGGLDYGNVDYAAASGTAYDPFTGEETNFKDADNE